MIPINFFSVPFALFLREQTTNWKATHVKTALLTAQ